MLTAFPSFTRQVAWKEMRLILLHWCCYVVTWLYTERETIFLFYEQFDVESSSLPYLFRPGVIGGVKASRLS